MRALGPERGVGAVAGVHPRLVVEPVEHPGDDVVDQGSFVADGSEQTVEEDVAAGEFRLAVSATDQFDRTTTDVTNTRIGTDPTPLGLIALVVLGLLAVAGGAAAAVRQLRRRPPAWAVLHGLKMILSSTALRARKLAHDPRKSLPRT